MARKLWRMNGIESPVTRFPSTNGPSRVIFALAVSLLLAGCNSEDDVRTYNVPKSPRAQVATGGGTNDAGQGVPSRMLAAMIPRAGQSWFFKLVGPEATVAQQRESFLELVQSIQFKAGDGPPQWFLPEGWSQQPGSRMRYATIRPSPDDPTLELSVIPLPTAGGSETEYILSNINRWRDQLGLSPIAAEDLEAALPIDEADAATAIIRVSLSEDIEAIVVDISGTSTPSTGRGGPFASGMAQPQGPMTQGGAAPQTATSLTYDVPEGWQEEAVSGMRKASFRVTLDDQSAEISVIDLPESPLAANVNRWRGQIALPALSPAEIEEQAEAIEIDGHPGHYVEMWADDSAPRREAILAVIVNVDGKSWFIKLRGDADVAQAQREAFRDFLESINF